MPKSTLSLKATVTRRQAEPVPSDLKERLAQLQHHEAQAAENAATTAQEAPTATPEPAPVPKAKPNPHALQSAFLAGNLGKPITAFLINGVMLTGKLRQFDQFTLLLQGPDGLNSLVFKHAITTVMSAIEAPGKQLQPNKTDEAHP